MVAPFSRHWLRRARPIQLDDDDNSSADESSIPDDQSLKCLCTECKAAEELRLHISDLCPVPDGLRSKLSEARMKVNQAHSSIINRLIPEVLSSVFELCVADEHWEDFPFKTKSVPPFTQLTIGAVCRAWRQIAWSTPQLWTIVCFSPRKFGLFYQIERAREWLDRSGDLPLSLKLSSRNGHEVPGNWEKALLLVNGYSSRLKFVDANLSAPLLKYLSNTIGATFPLLKRWRVRASLQTVDFLNLRPIIFNFKDLSSNWSHVTHACMSYIAIDEAVQLLIQAPQLIDFRIEHAMEVKRHFAFPEQPISHQLSCLAIAVKTGDPNEFFESFTLPKLTRLDCVGDDPRLCETLVAFLARSHCTLYQLYLNGVPADTGTLSRLLTATPSVVELRLILGVGSNPDEVLQLLADTSLRPIDEAGPCDLLPHLVMLQFWPEERISWGRFIDIFGPIDDIHNARRRPLRIVQLILDEWNATDQNHELCIPSDPLQRIQELIKAGINISIRATDAEDDAVHDPGCDLIQLSLTH